MPAKLRAEMKIIFYFFNFIDFRILSISRQNIGINASYDVHHRGTGI